MWTSPERGKYKWLETNIGNEFPLNLHVYLNGFCHHNSRGCFHFLKMVWLSLQLKISAPGVREMCYPVIMNKLTLNKKSTMSLSKMKVIDKNFYYYYLWRESENVEDVFLFFSPRVLQNNESPISKSLITIVKKLFVTLEGIHTCLKLFYSRMCISSQKQNPQASKQEHNGGFPSRPRQSNVEGVLKCRK